MTDNEFSKTKVHSNCFDERFDKHRLALLKGILILFLVTKVASSVLLIIYICITDQTETALETENFKVHVAVTIGQLLVGILLLLISV